MGPERRKQLLAALASILAVVMYRAWTSTSAVNEPTSNEPGSAARAPARRPQSAPIAEPDVHLEALGADRPKPVEAERNLFRFKPKAAPPPSAPPTAGRGAVPPPRPPMPVQTGPPPPPAPPIALKFIGIVEARERGLRIAVLSDGRNVFQGVEGAIIEGRYRIVHIGTESIDMEYIDGRGRRTIRLTGS